MKKRERMYSPFYQEVIIVIKRGKNVDSDGYWLLDTNGRCFSAETFVPFPGGGNF